MQTPSKKLYDWLQVIGLFGVFGGLIFVGLQLRQERQIALLSAVAEGADRRLAWAENMSINSDVWLRGLAGEQLTDSESAQFDALAAALELRYFNNWYRNSTIGDSASAVRWTREAALDFHTHPGLMNWWEDELARRAVTDPGTSNTWITAVNAEIDSFRKEP